MDSIALSDQVQERYRRYLKTTFYFRDPELRASFDGSLEAGHLAKGPYLEATPVFKRGAAPNTLFPALLGFTPDGGFLKTVQQNTPTLYKHQEEALRRIFGGHNVIVATGTGSGKTEAFLYSILLRLYQEFRSGTLDPGTRALVLYPMNALANDQRQRLGALCASLQREQSPFQFTFGQYTGETPEDESDAARHGRDHVQNRLTGELVLRSEMRSTPPHILLTNYSMLEYLSLRPSDSPLFDNGRARWWTFLVLDEAHQYRGSRGTEMAMLVRRLKQRLREGGCREPFRCIATSASLLGAEEDKSAVAKFAAALFGEDFTPEDVVLGEPEAIPRASGRALGPGSYRPLRECLDGDEERARQGLARFAKELEITLPADLDIAKAIGGILQHDDRAEQLRRLITGSPVDVREAADMVFRDLAAESRVAALAEFTDLLLKTKDPASGAPLLSARYHLFLRTLEGAFVAYWPQKKVFLDRKTATAQSVAFEVALCRECGQHYFVGPRDFGGGKLGEAIRDPSHPDFGASFFRPLESESDLGDDEDSTTANQVFQLCLQCGELRRGSVRCGHEHLIPVVRENPPEDEDRADQMARCGACGYRGGGRDPVREIIYGSDGPHAVIATTLYQQLPAERRKVLAFADGRQEAAFFAWYLEDSYKDILGRNLLINSVRRLSPYVTEGLSLQEVATSLRDVLRERRDLPATAGELELRREGWLRVYREFLTDEARISPEGVGLIRYSMRVPDWFIIPPIFSSHPWRLSDLEARELLFLLLDSMRADRAVELLTEPAISVNWADLGLQASQMGVRVGAPRRPKGVANWPVQSWDGQRGHRAAFLAKLLMRKSIPREEALACAGNALRALWEAVAQCDRDASGDTERLLIPVDDARRLNPRWWRVHATAHEDIVFRCDTCGRLHPVAPGGICPRYQCPGILKGVRVGQLEANHYRMLYEEALPGYMRVEEHTAQLDKEKARDFQRDFRSGKIHILSCSTTFELGVDLGDLDTIFLRNVPPEAFNYSQRIGRAGRRSGYPGFAITYCRRGPHDLYHFAEPERMLLGKVRAPMLSLGNEKIITRHVAAVALSAFFRTNPERVGSVQSLLQDFSYPAAAADLKYFLDQNRSKIEQSLSAIVPSHMYAEVGLDDGQWIERVAGRVRRNLNGTTIEEESRFALAVAEVCSDYTNLTRLQIESSNKQEYRTAEWCRKRATTIASEDVISFLSRKAVIPKYGFPVDVVELDTHSIQQTQEGFDVVLQRDLSIAISEFAPSNKLIANKRLWTSYGLKKVAGKEWERKRYKRCARHNAFYQWSRGEAEPPSACGDRLQRSEYIVPRFGFVSDRDKPRQPTARPARVFTTRPYFAGPVGPDPGTIYVPPESPVVAARKASPGLMVVLCEGRRGQGFYICNECGAGFRKAESKHKTAYGQQCRGLLSQVSLGHEFVTEVLQLQFLPRPLPAGADVMSFALSLAYALVEGAADTLDVPSTDINAVVAHGGPCEVPPIILYDNVPGGAGLVSRLEDESTLWACLRAGEKRVSGNCGCDEATSCYGCLRSYRNQFAHQQLQRGPVLNYLKSLLSSVFS